MKNPVRHIATVVEVREGEVLVSMKRSSACSSCHAADLCRSSENQDMEVSIRTRKAAELTPGQCVVIEGRETDGLRATLLAYVVPIVIILATLVVGIPAMGEASSALLSIVLVGVWYALLSCMKGLLARQFSFEIIRN